MTPECDDCGPWTKPSLERITVLGDGSFAEILPARAEKFGELCAVTMLREVGTPSSRELYPAPSAGFRTLHVSREELHRFLLGFRLLGEKIAQCIPSAAEFPQLPSSCPDYLREPGDATVVLAQTCSRVLSTRCRQLRGTTEPSACLQLQQSGYIPSLAPASVQSAAVRQIGLELPVRKNSSLEAGRHTHRTG